MGREAHEDGSYTAREHKLPGPAFTENKLGKLHACILLKSFIVTLVFTQTSPEGGTVGPVNFVCDSFWQLHILIHLYLVEGHFRFLFSFGDDTESCLCVCVNVCKYMYMCD